MLWVCAMAELAKRFGAKGAGDDKNGGKLDVATDQSTLHMRVLPTDLDINGHMNNGRYLTIMDLGRMDLMLRSGMMTQARAKGWLPVLGSATIRYRQPLKPFQKFKLETRILGWEDKWFYVEQKYTATSGKTKGQVAAYAIVKGAFADAKTGKAATVETVMNAIGYKGESPEIPLHIKHFIAAEDTLRAATSAPRPAPNSVADTPLAKANDNTAAPPPAAARKSAPKPPRP